MEDKQQTILWVSIVVMALILFANGGFRSLVTGLSEKRRMEKMLVQLRAEHEALTLELNALQQDPAYTEYLIRKNLGYVKKGEVEYRILKKN